MADESVSSLFTRKSSGLIRSIAPHHSLSYAVMNMAIGGVLFNWAVASGIYLGINDVWASLLFLPFGIIPGLAYAYMTSAMPRTGGDYVWTSRIYHPIIGFMINFYATMVYFIFIAAFGLFAWQIPIVGMVSGTGLITGNASLVSLGSILLQPTFAFIGSLIVIVAFGLLAVFGAKIANKIAIGLFLSGIAALALNLAMLMYYKSSIISGLTAAGAGYKTVANLAAHAGYVFPGFAALGTFLGLAWVASNSIGYTNVCYISGEIKDPRAAKSTFIPIFGSLVIIAILNAVTMYYTYLALTPAYYHDLSYLWVIGSSSYPLATLAVPNIYGMLAYGHVNLALYLIDGVLWLLTFASFPFAVTYVFTRNIFAWSFDRIIPSWFTKVSKRAGTPIYAVLLAVVVSIIWDYFYMYTGLPSLLAYGAAGWYLAWVIVGSAILVMFRVRPELLELLPEAVRRKVSGMPVISWLGLGTILISGYLVYAYMMPGVFAVALVFLIALLILGPVIYAISYYINKQRGIPVELARKLLPPE